MRTKAASILALKSDEGSSNDRVRTLARSLSDQSCRLQLAPLSTRLAILFHLIGPPRGRS